MRHVSGLERARSALERNGRFPAGTLTLPVARSWRRCVERGLDPRGRPESPVVTIEELRERRERREFLRRLAIAEMQLLYSQIAGSNFMIAFADPDGVVLDTISDHQFADTSAGRSIIPGSVWQEELRGTNALGLALIEGTPVGIHGREHFFACHGQVSCMAAPILDSKGRIVGLLDASCSHEARQHHTLALVRMATAQIENSLIFYEQSDLLIFAFHPRVEYLGTLSAGLIAVSPDGQIRSMNLRSQALLAGLDAREGCRFEDLFDAGFETTATSLLDGGVTHVRDHAGSGVFMVCRQIGGRRRDTEEPAARPVVRATTAQPRGPFVCDDSRLSEQITAVEQAVHAAMPIHIKGETGTGKELMARHAHSASGRKGEFVAVNCGAIPESLFVAELFGHERGAFTNARTDGSPGLIRIADKGTLFLDEVGEIPLAAQAALLRFLDTMEVRPVGGQKVHVVDAQIVSATNRDLQKEVATGRFRADLYYRLTAMEVTLPALRERMDFPEIVRFVMHQIAPGLAITDGAVRLLRAQPWNGNIRELRSTLQRSVLRTRNRFVDEAAISPFVQGQADDVCPECHGHALNSAKCRQIREVFHAANGNIAECARLLNISRTTVYKHLSGVERNVQPAPGKAHDHTG
ncbi:MAG: sigma-54-dependent Fis family transcriptional regulator [Bauldia sp.]|nr:sigma-54-dependent Fis family transcriptional regulator [Bauldia sp.]